MAEPALSVVVPARDEGGIIAGTLRGLAEGLASVPGGFEIVVADDGSADATAAEVDRAAVTDPRIRLVRGPRIGRGAAIRAGLAAARGDVVVTTDADLSYGPGEALKLFEHLRARPSCDMVIGSCYMPGGRTEGVPFGRLIVSSIGNRTLRFAFEGRFFTTTGILRGYRRERLQTLLRSPGLVSAGKEMYLEVLHNALCAGWVVDEIPATMTWRRGPGGGTFSFLPTAWSHLTFLLARRRKHALLLTLALTTVAAMGWCVICLLAWDGPMPDSEVFWCWIACGTLFGYGAFAILMLTGTLLSLLRWNCLLKGATPPPPAP